MPLAKLADEEELIIAITHWHYYEIGELNRVQICNL